MAELRACLSCGAALSTDAPEALCAACSPKLGTVAAQSNPLKGTSPTSTTQFDFEAGEQPGNRIGHYKLLQRIGEGGMGTVWMAEQEEPVRRRVALKVIKLGMDTRQVIARFEAERQALALMDHSCIAKVLDAGATESGRPYFVMELVQGMPITRYCDDNQLSIEERLQLYIGVCRAIQHAHQKGVIHRDIKPSNILVSLQEGKPSPKVIDFGIAKATAGQQLTDKTLFTAIEQFIGTPAYMSPEQAEMSSMDIDTRSDIYSLGVLLYELLVGSTPFETQELLAAGLDGMRRAIREKDPVRPSTRLNGLSGPDQTATALRRGVDAPKLIHMVRGDLDWIVMKCLEKDRTRRFETANGVAMDIQRFLDQEPIIARPPSRTYRLRRLIQRNKVAFASVALVTATLLAALWVSTMAVLDGRKVLRLVARAREAEARQKNEAVAARAKAEEEREQARALRYCSDMGLAWRALREHNLAQLTSLLEAQIPRLGERDFRAWEWRYLWQARRGDELSSLGPFDGEVIGLCLLSDGRLATGEMDAGRVRLWDLERHQVVRENTHLMNVSDLAVSPDGRLLAVARWSDNVRFLNAESLEDVGGLRHAHSVLKVTFAPDGKFLSASGGEDVSLWEVATRQLRWSRPSRTGGLCHPRFSPDGQWLVYPLDGHLGLLKVEDGIEIRQLPGGGDDVADLALSGDGRRLAVATWGGGVLLMDLLTRQMQLLTNHAGPVRALAFRPDGRQLASAGNDGLVKLWEVDSGQETASFRGHQKLVSSLVYSADGQRVVTGAKDRTVRVWTSQPGPPSASPLVSPGFSNVAVSRDGRFVVAADSNGMWRVAALDNGRETGRVKGPDRLSRCALGRDGRELAFGTADGAVQVWNLAEDKVSWSFQAHSNRVEMLEFSPDGNLLASASPGGEIRVWERGVSHPRMDRRLGSAEERTWALAFSADGAMLAVSAGGVIRLLSLRHPSEDREITNSVDYNFYSLDISSDGRLLAAGADDAVAVWDLPMLRQVTRIGDSQWNFSGVAFSPDGRRLMGTVATLGTTWLWDLPSGREVGRFDGDARWGRFQPEGDAVVIVGERRCDVLRVPALSEIDNQRDLAAKERELLQLQRAATAEHERVLRAQDPGAVRQWLVLAPIALEVHSGLAALDQEYIAQIDSLQPRPGDRTRVGSCELMWRAVQLKDYVLDFNSLLGRVTEWSVGYAVCYIRTEAEQADLVMKVGSDDGTKAFLNGKEIYSHQEGRAYSPDEDVVDALHLKGGLNVLVLKVMNELGDWKASVRFTDAYGNPAKGIKVTLTPD